MATNVRNSDDYEPNIVSFFGKHLVAMSCDIEIKGNESASEARTLVFSGFVVDIGGSWIWMTAGHCLHDALDRPVKDGEIRICGGGFMDYFSHEARHLYQIPFIYEPGCGFYVDDETWGVDFGVIPLDWNKQELMKANGIVPIDRRNWEFQGGMSFDLFKLLGFPTHHPKVPDDERDEKKVGAVLVSLQKIDASEYPDASSPDWFMGKIVDESKIEDVAGMSGGPILGIRQVQVEGKMQWAYHVIAIQSRWKKGRRIVLGCPFPTIAELLYSKFRDAEFTRGTDGDI